MRDAKGKDVGGKEATLINGKQYSIVLDNKQREAIKEGKGNSSMSEYVRECIDLRTSPAGSTEQEEELKQSKEKILEQAKQIKQYEQAEQRRQKVNEEQLAYIGMKYMAWEKTTGLNNGRTRLAWAQGCVLGLPISPEDALSYLQGQGFFALE